MTKHRIDWRRAIAAFFTGTALLWAADFSRAELVGLWSFDGSTEDASGFGHHGELMNGASFAADVPDVLTPGQSLQVSGGQQHVLIPDADRLDIEEAITISVWVKPVGNLSWDGILAKAPSEGSGANHAGNYELRIDDGSRVLHLLYQQGGTNDTQFLHISGVVIPEGEWSHVAVTAERSGEVNYYLNGELAETHATPVADMFGVPNDNPLHIGSRADLFTTFDGFLDEVALYDEVLSAEDIAVLATGPADPSRQPDRDGDGIPDSVEDRLDFLDPDNPADGAEDQDGDGVSNAQEFANRTDMTNPDTDGDGLGDGVETNTGVWVGPQDTGTNPRLADTDGDGLPDGVETNSGVFNGPEDPGTSPLLADTDGDGFGDGVEVTLGSNPVDPDSSPEGVVLTRSAGNDEDWNTAELWSDGQVPQAGANYLVVGSVAGELRSPREADPVFGGDQLSLIGAPSALLLQHSGVARMARLGLDNALLRTARSGELILGADDDVVAVTAASTIQFDAAATLVLGVRLEGASPLLVEQPAGTGGTANAVLVLQGVDNPFSGGWTVRNATLRGSGVGSLGTGDIFLENGVLDADYNVGLTERTLDIIGEESRIVLDQILAFGAVTLNAGAIAVPEGAYDYDAIGGLFGGGLIETFVDGGGLLVVGGDLDGDGLPDVWEEQVFGNTAQTGEGDADEDGLSNGDEFRFGTNPTVADTDGDGLSDGAEVAGNPPTNPLLADTDGDGLPDPVETNTGVFVGPEDTGTDPTRADTDGDGLSDGVETGTGVFVDAMDTGTSPVLADTDGDGVNDGQEVRTGTDPHDPDDFLALLPGLAGWWPFDGNAADASGQGNNGEALNGAVFSDDVPPLLGGGQSLRLEGGDQHVLVPHNATLDMEVAMSIAAWVKPVGEIGWDGILAKNPSDGSASNHAGNYELRIDNGTRLLHFLYQRGGVDDTNFHPSAGAAIPPDVWTHVAVTAERSGEARFYVDGELVEVHAAPVADTFGALNTNPLYIGSRADLFTTFDGFLDDVALFDTALTQGQIQDVMRGDFGGAALDSDGDGMTDEYENRFPFLDANNPADATEDFDNDGLTNLRESQLGTRPDLEDTDGDGLLDGVETKTGVFVDANDTGSDPLRVDTDGDGLADGDEVNGNNPGGFVSDPNLVDTDGDGFADGVEVAAGTDPSDPNSFPVAELAALWRFDADGAGQPDATGNGNAADLGTSVWVDDPERGGAVDLGEGSFLEVADSEGVSLTGDLTLAAWIRVTDFSTWRGLLGKTESNLPAPYDYYLITGSGVPILYRGDGAGSVAAVQAEAAPALGVWQHVAVTMSGNMVRHYLNGQPNGMGTLNLAAIADLDGTLRIGGRADGVTQMLGRMDDVAVFAGALTQAQIQDIMAGDFSDFGIGGEDAVYAAVESIAYDAAAGTIVLTWRSTAGVVYQVEFSPDLRNWMLRPGEIVADGELSTSEEELPDEPAGNYRVREKP
ncbi:MAG TPA: LamG-like jellyroll fold domain-containing protein [Verrucomicrobiales bacterium]|nr:LamG-like jellyroll fold domain-containing protein [Verrucomicrobiales bacterium]